MKKILKINKVEKYYLIIVEIFGKENIDGAS